MTRRRWWSPRRALLIEIANLQDVNRALAGEVAVETALHGLATDRVRELRLEVAALRRQNLALDAQLDHMTRVNQALDAGITTTTTQERT